MRERLGRAVAGLVLVALLSGCVASDAGPAAPPADDAAPSPGLVEAAATLTRQGCVETHAYVPAPRSDFEPLPEGYSLVLDQLGQATLGLLHQACAADDEMGQAVWVFVLLDVPEALRREGAAHGGLVMVSATDLALLAAMSAWSVTAEAHPMSFTSTHVARVAEARIRAQPDFVMTAQGAGDEPLGLEALRLIDFETGVPGGVFDRDRPATSGVHGVATASLLLEARVGDFPDHRVGTGAISLAQHDVLFTPVPSP